MINQKRLYIETFGCAMNQKDSEHIIAELEQKNNYKLIDIPKDADLIIINTCSVREKPIHKLFSELGQFHKIKKKGAKIGVCGCTASHLGKEIIKKAPYVNFVLGARNISKISQVINQNKKVEIDLKNDDSRYIFANSKISNLKTSVNISIGCNKKCTFCIVPFTRGTEISIPTDIILDEIKRNVDNGTKEILLLGQNVNNYNYLYQGTKINFTTLLRKVSEINGIERIRFTSPHPLHMDNEFIDEFGKNRKIAKSIHVPLQSGSTKILKSMKRGYSKEWFLNRIDKIRELVPDVAISSDIIVGFPNESNLDFEETIEVLNYTKFEQLFSFVYSPRPHTEAETFLNRVPIEIAKERLKKLQDLQIKILDEVAKNRKGKIFEVLIDSVDKLGRLTGRNSQNHIIKIKQDNKNLIGTLQKVKILESFRTESIGVIF
jgi:tRNA-2-methylthio-N6-dimethylallyladenosine synthase